MTCYTPIQRDTLIAAPLTARVIITWVNARGCDRDCEVEVDYTFNGNDLTIISDRALTESELPSDYDELVYDAVWDVADDEFTPLAWAAEAYVPSAAA